MKGESTYSLEIRLRLPLVDFRVEKSGRLPERFVHLYGEGDECYVDGI